MIVRDTGVEKKSERLSGKHIAIAICGGIAAVEVVKIIRELRRHGATVSPFMTAGSERFVGKDAVSWAAGRDAIVEASYRVEYLDPFDLVLVAPLSFHTLAKSALGLTDNVVSLLIASQLGNRKSLLLVPTMNVSLFQHPLYSQYRARLESWGALFLENRLDEERIKIPSEAEIAQKVLELF